MRVHLTNGGSLAPSTLDMAIGSYLVPIPAAVFNEAQAAQAACPAVTGTTKSGLQVRLQITAGEPPHLGDQAWRVNMAPRAAESGIVLTGTLVIVMVRIGQTLIQAYARAINDVLDETLFLDALARAVQALS